MTNTAKQLVQEEDDKVILGTIRRLQSEETRNGISGILIAASQIGLTRSKQGALQAIGAVMEILVDTIVIERSCAIWRNIRRR